MTWYRQWFTDELYSILYAHRDKDEARLVIDLFQRVATVPEQSIILDLACGTGRHSFELARRGYHVVAVDLSPTLLSVARRKTRKYAKSSLLLRADMRSLPLARLDAVVQLFTAFGYFRDDSENAAVIGEVRSSLNAGAWYMLDFLNAEHVIQTLVPRTEQRIDGGSVIQHRQIENGRVVKRITVQQHGRIREFIESVRLFTLDDFRRMFQEHDFELEVVFGDYGGAPFDADSPRCLMFARAR